ncbi:hypothetical protein E1B28_003598 [Marasmius oreades]|nr:uncharacterized protein E1B28_003598 [Marasmius oreades]KAG7086082.1 hypothetical protein E1B28_003598 [Marasmius oreades]
MQILPDIPDWQDTEGDWGYGQEVFSRFNEETDLMESSMRSFLEECDHFQGLQVISDTSSFGSFMYSLLCTFGDELSKTSPIVVPLVADVVPQTVAEPSISRKIINEALYLRGLRNDLPSSTTVIPVQVPSNGHKPRWKSQLTTIDDSDYHTSALLSAHIENATIPLRSKVNRETIPIFSSSLNRHGLHHFSQLSGVVPVSFSNDVDMDAVSSIFWCGKAIDKSEPTGSAYFARRDVTRALYSIPSSTHTYDGTIIINNSMRSSTRLPPYPIPTSFPSILVDNKEPRILVDRGRAKQGSLDTSLPAGTANPGGPVGIFSSLSVSPAISSIFADYARFVSKCVEQRRGWVEDHDGLKELVNDLWTIHDGYVDMEGKEPNDSDNDEASD